MDDPYPAGLFLFLVDIFTTPVVFYLINGLILAFLLLMSALVSGSETAFFSMNSEQISSFKKSNDAVENRIFELIRYPKRLLATILILNNLINVAIVTLSTFVTWQIVGTKTTEGLVVVLLTAIITFAIVFFGEVVPKVFANQNNTVFARRTSLLIMISQNILKPISWLLLSLNNLIEKRIEKKGYIISVDDLNQALEITKKDTSDEEKDILKGIVNFGMLSVKQIMRSRIDISAFEIDMDFHELMDKINKLGFSRIPIFKETIDKIEGILYIKDLLPYIEEEEDFAWQKLLRPGYFVPESKKIDDLLKDFQEKRVHMAIVVDEYGGTSGLITMEDIIEEIVGEINDEFDDDEIAYNKLDENTFVFEGKTSLNDFCKIINEDPNIFEEVKGESESLGGLILELNSKLPRSGDKIRFNKFVFTVVAVDNRRIKRVRVLIQAPTIKNSEEK
ncbi:MAG: gliding motility-associated protein GldE [Candidatus Cyclobacteriaceae bacterium M3_2C_046]